MFTVALFTIAKTWKQPDCPLMDGWVKKTWNTHTHTHRYTHTYREWHIIQPQKEGNCVICNNMDGIWRHYTEWNKSEKDKYCMILLICGI